MHAMEEQIFDTENLNEAIKLINAIRCHNRVLSTIGHGIISFLFFSQNMLKIHKNKHVKGENSQKATRGQKGLSPM